MNKYSVPMNIPDPCALSAKEMSMSDKFQMLLTEMGQIEDLLQQAMYNIDKFSPVFDPVQTPKSHYESLDGLNVKVNNIRFLAERLRDLLR